MKQYVVRHASTGVTRDLRGKYGPAGPPLSDIGIQEAKRLQQALLKAGIDSTMESVAVSDYLRTQQTAELAGFKTLHINAKLEEIYTGIPNPELKAMLAERKLPPIVLERAQAILDNPPKEKVWITHGLVIMGLFGFLGFTADEFFPVHAKVYEFDI